MKDVEMSWRECRRTLERDHATALRFKELEEPDKERVRMCLHYLLS